ncbi:alpha/beta hydrolase [Paenibacillus sp. MBLB4367]|uniref:alpha/beta hydrolase n=1 Tax=Paenibacillus sp. MBLB4367 TaxID=3384767 RepID=UPI00390834D5
MYVHWPYRTSPPNSPPAWPAPALAGHAQGVNEDDREKQQSLTFVLVHGSWADAGFWDRVAAELRNKGHIVYAPEYPGHGSDPNKAVTHAMITKSVADFIVSRHLRNIVLAGHSFGGSVIQKVAELVPDRIRRLVFLNAFVLKDGESVADEVPPPVREAFQQLRQSSKDDTIMLPFPLYRETFANLASLGLVQQMYNSISPEPAKPLFEKLDLKTFYRLNIPKSYLYLTEDTALPQGSSEYGWHPHMSSRLGLFRLIQGHGDHMSTVRTQPGMIAHKLYEAGRD